MRNLILILLVLLAPAVASAETLKNLHEGEKFDTENLSGNVIVVVWASWSPKCRDIVEQINALEQNWGSKARVVSVVFQEKADDVRTFLAGAPKMNAPVYLDSSGSFSKSHHVTALPGLLIYKDGAEAFRGKLPSDPDSLISRTLE